MIDYTEQVKILEEIEEHQEQDLLTAIQLIFYLNPLFYRSVLVKRSRFRIKKPCFDLMEFEDEEFFNKHCQKCQRPLSSSNPNTLCLECESQNWF